MESPNSTEQIWRELSDQLRQFVRTRVSSEPDVDDILQSVFVRIHENLVNLRRRERLQAWVFQLTRNAIADHFRTRKVVDADLALIPAEPTHSENANKEIAGCVAALVKQLPPEHRRAVSMFEMDGMSQQAIADIEAISLSGAKSRIQRGRKKLEAMLRDCCQFQFDAFGNVLEYSAQKNYCENDADCSQAGPSRSPGEQQCTAKGKSADESV